MFRMPVRGDLPDYVLHGPVIIQEWDHLWMGARECTNNTGEVTAIGEAMHWLLTEAPDDGTLPVKLRFDSFYAANIAQGIYEPKSNEEIAKEVRKLTEQVVSKRTIIWEHVYGHSGAHDNELADRAADSGAKGLVSNMSQRWAAPPPPTQQLEADQLEYCRKCGELVMKREHVWHVRRCTVRGLVIPEDKEKCRKCGILVDRGTRKTHEQECTGAQPDPASGPAAPLAPAAKAARRAKAKAKGGAKAKAKGKAKVGRGRGRGIG